MTASSDLRRLDTDGPPVFFPAGEEDSARILAAAARRSARVVGERWGLSIPNGCRMYVLTDWEGFLAHSTPRRARLLLRMARPLWRGRVERTFDLAGGWTVAWKGRPAVAVKSVDQLAKSRSSIGERLFEPVPDLAEKVLHLACHELTHACTAHLRLPAWLNEGVAMRAVDHLAGSETIRASTRSLAHADPGETDRRAYRRVRPEDHESLLRLYATGYWVTRRLDEHAPELLGELLARRPRRSAIARALRAVRRD